ncbi:MAG: LLM class F420-dependent oxidoreductase, partial [Candidatus Tectomicrobia bacterium]
IEGRINLPSTTPEIRVKEAEAWRELGATHLSVNTMRAGLRTPTEHIAAIKEFQQTVADVVAG